jgi:hypothetical protein
MSTPKILFAGADFSSGRQPVTIAGLDETLNIVCLEKMEIEAGLTYLKQAGQVTLALNVPSTKTYQAVYSTFNKKVALMEFKPYAAKAVSRQSLETSAQTCFRVLIGKAPLPRRTFEGRVQRALILYDQGLRINDPMDFFEEITRHHMRNGVFPNELLYSAHEVDSLMAAYVAWLAVNEPTQVEIMGNNLMVTKEPERD